MDEKEKYLTSIPKGDAPADAKALEIDAQILTWYARKDTLRHVGLYLFGNFIDVPGYGCLFQYMRSLPWVRVITIRDLRPCEDPPRPGTLVEITLSPK